MKCENCGSELSGGAIVCRQCNHNNAQGRVSQWRARRTADLQPPSTRTISPLSDAAKPANTTNTGSLNQTRSNSRPLEPRKPNSIPFEPKIQINHVPPSPKGSSGSLPVPPAVPAAGNDAETGQPAWREQLKERVKQSRERKVSVSNPGKTEPEESELDQNPIVESALKRIRWSAHTPSAAATMPRVARRGAQAAALAHEPEFDVEPPAPIESKPLGSQTVKTEPTVESKTAPKPTTGIAPTVTNPLLARRPNTQPVNPPETKPQLQVRHQLERPAERPAAAPKPEPKPQVEPRAEARIEIKPAARQETKPAAESKVAEQKPRVTGELKPPAPPAPPPVMKPPEKVQPEKSPSGPLSPTARKPVETKVIGLPQPDAPLPATKQKTAAKDRPANTWVRTLAGACDFEIIATAYLPLFASHATLNNAATLNIAEGMDSLIILFVLLGTLTFCYQLLTLTLAGRTSGMALLNLRLVNTAGNDKPILFSQKFARAVVATAVFLFPLLNLISNRQHHTLPDMFSGTTLMER